MRFMVYNRNYDQDFKWETSTERRAPNMMDFKEPWVVESVDGGHEETYASHEDAINGIYEGSK